VWGASEFVVVLGPLTRPFSHPPHLVCMQAYVAVSVGPRVSGVCERLPLLGGWCVPQSASESLVRASALCLLHFQFTACVFIRDWPASPLLAPSSSAASPLSLERWMVRG
jgi:hypothetical protein